MKLLTNKQWESNENAEICYVCKEMFEDKYAKDKDIVRLEIIAIIRVNKELLHVVYVI